MRAEDSTGPDRACDADSALAVPPARFRVLLEGVAAAWESGAELRFDPAAPRCRFLRDGAEAAIVSVERQPFGAVWRVAAPGRRERAHASVLPALRGLRGLLCPERPGGRVFFARDDGA